MFSEPMLARSSSFGNDGSVTDSPFMPIATMDGMEYLQYPNEPSPNFSGAMNSSSDFDLMTGQVGGDYMYTASPFSNSEPQPYMPENELSISPRAMISNLSDGERSPGRRSRSNGSASPPAIPYAATVPRSVRYDPMTTVGRRNSTASRRIQKSTRRRRTSDDSDDEDEDEEYQGSNASGGGPVETRRESVRQQRIESEQRRRDDLRKHYDQLRDVLPAQQVRLSKVAILAKATERIRELEIEVRQKANLVESMSSETSKMRRMHDSLVARALANPALHLGEY